MQISNRLLSSRCYTPNIPKDFVVRNNLLSKLDHSFSYPLTLFTAPAGFGKSTSTIHALQTLQKSFVWYEIHHQDSPLNVFWAYIIYAIQHVNSNFGESLLGKIDTYNDEAWIKSREWLDIFNEELETLPNRIILVLDNYHNVINPIIHQSIQELIKHLSPQLGFVILTRHIPSFNLTALRLQHKLSELSLVDLQFTLTTIRQFYRQGIKTEIREEMLEQLSQKTEGWIIALQLIRMTIEYFPQQFDQLTQKIDGNALGIFDYFAEEITQHLEADVKHFLLQTSTLSTFTPELCNHLLNIDNSPDIINILIQRNLFVIQLDIKGQHYRYHNLFADFLRSHLSEEESQHIHQKAAVWYASQKMYLEAVDYALETNDFSTIIPLVKDAVFHMLNRQEFDPIFRWFEYIPQESVQENLELTILRAWTFITLGDIPSATQYIDLANHLATAKPISTQTYYQLQVIRGIFYYVTIDYDKATSILNELQSVFEELHTTLKLSILMTLCGIQHYYGNFKRIKSLLEPHMYIVWEEDAGLAHIFVLEHYVDALVEMGHMQTAKQLIKRFLEKCKQNTIWNKFRGMILDDYSRIHFYEHHLEEAKARVTQAIALLHEAEFFGASLPSLYLLSEITAFEGNYQQAMHYLQSATQIDAGILMEWIQEEIKNAQMRVHDLAHDYKHIQTWYDSWEGHFPLRPRAIPIIVHYIASHESPEQAITTLQTYREQLEVNGLVVKTIVIDLTIARLYFELEDRQQALQYLATAISTAFQGGYIQPFVEEAEWLTPLLPSLRNVAPHFIDRVLKCMPKPQLIAFTNRETEIIPLLKQGHTNREIAHKLGISINTIKYHLKQIFRKLEADNRIQAVQKLSQHFED